jgi:cellulose binding protein with CBM2 domain
MSVSDLARRAFRRVVPLVVLASAATAGAVGAATPAHAGVAECQLQYTVVATWNNETAFQADITVTNIGSTPTTGWVALVDLPWGTQPVSVWNATEGSWPMSTGVLYNFTNVSWDGAMAPGEQRSFGFLATGTVHTPIATTCSVS